jgi:predicted Zn-ribbon and HTH transcriptional regulator|tara:strand:- start:3690 stop:3914 length:225 start_codon:yes stop_codon:yes gene_type:complete
MLTSDIIFLFLTVLLVGWAMIAYYARRQNVKFDYSVSHDRVFHCKGCEYVYTDDDDVERSLCPECGQMNNSVQF